MSTPAKNKSAAPSSAAKDRAPKSAKASTGDIAHRAKLNREQPGQGQNVGGFMFLLAGLAFALVSIISFSIDAPARTYPGTLAGTFGPPGKALVLTAHPDDEVMFFTPTILTLQAGGWDIWGLCLSTGDSEGQGETRRHELTASYKELGVGSGKVMVVDHPLLQDDMSSRWSPNIVGAVVDSYLSERDFGMIITFDSQGISNHPNHASLSTYRSNSTSTYHLVSPPLATKYTGPVLRIIPPRLMTALQGMWSSMPGLGSVVGTKENGGITIETNSKGWQRGVRAMRQHRTQLVWYRWLYLLSSRMMWVNQLVKVE